MCAYLHVGSYKLISTQLNTLISMEIQFVFFICGLCYTFVHCWSCPQDVTRVYARPGSRAVIDFQTTIQQGLISYNVAVFNGTYLLTAQFYNGELQNDVKEHLNSIFIGDAATGNFTLQTNNLQTMDAGVYMLQYRTGGVTTTAHCSTLYILGIPTQPIIQSSNDPSVGDVATLTCNCTSTTSPRNHSLSLSYNWNVNNSPVASSGRYSLSGNTLVVSNVAKTDTNLKFTCTATEVVTNGYTSDRSGEYSVNVLYGPDAGTTTLSPGTTTYTVNSGSTLNDITCAGDCYPDCSYMWTKPGNGGLVDVISTGVLPMGSLVRSEAAIYTCTVTNPRTGGSTTKEVTVNVRYGPFDDSTTYLSPAASATTRNEGDKLSNITCSADCYPECSYKWTKSDTDNIVSSTGVLSLETLARTEDGIYTCTVTSSWTSVTVTRQVTVTVRYGPDAGTTTLTPKASTYTQNESTVLPDITCASDCYPDSNIKWTRLGSVTNNTGLLSLGTLNKNEAATYTCTVSNPEKSGTVTKQVMVSVRYGPDMCDISVESPYTVREGNNIPTITCQSDCYPACSQGWKNISIDNPVGSDGNFTLGTVTRYKAGNYACTCSNMVHGHYDKSLLNTVHVIVQYPPDVRVLLSTTDISEGKELILTCDAKGVPSVYNYNTLSQTWGNSDIHNPHSAASGTPMYSSLRIPSLQLQDSGTYTCRVNNGITNTRGVVEDSVDSVFIKVKVSPKIITQALRFTGGTGGTANIRVKFYSDPDILTVTFKRFNGSAITNSNKYNVSHYATEVSDKFHGTDVTLNGSQANMIISDLKTEDFGVYTLTLTNQLNSTDANIILDAESKPDEPTDFTHLYKDNAHILSWIGGFNGGHTQTFLLQTSIVGTEEWVNRTTIAEHEELYLQYNATISYLQPGTYTARIYSWNKKGVTNYVNLNVTIKSPEIPICTVAAVDGVVSTVLVVLIIVAGAVVFYKWRYGQKDRNPSGSSNRNIHNKTVEETSYYNVANPENTKSHQSAVSEFPIKSGPVQEHDIQGLSTYEALDARHEAMSTYSSLTAVVEKPALQQVTYDNLQLHNVSS